MTEPSATTPEALPHSFLARRRVVVAGASEDFGDIGRTILRELRSLGFDAVAVNPECDRVDGTPCYHHLTAVPGPIDAVVLAVGPERVTEVITATATCGIRRVWLVHGLRQSAHDDVRALCAAHGLEVVDGPCPLLFLASVGWFDR